MSAPNLDHHHPTQHAQRWNGAFGAIQQPINAVDPVASVVAAAAQGSANAEGPDAIREGKQKAKEVVAAAGAQLGTPSTQAQGPSMVNGASSANGTPLLSRKRSRDGSQKPLAAQGAGADRPTTSHDQVLMDRYMQRDMLWAASALDQSQRSDALLHVKQEYDRWYNTEVHQRRLHDPGSIFGPGYLGYGNGTTNDKSQIVYSSVRRPPKGRRNHQLRLSRKENNRQAEEAEELVPVRLDIELERMRLRDTFTWNIHERLISQDQFAEYLLEDLRVPPENVFEVSRQIKTEMHEQINNYYPHPFLEEPPAEPGRPYSEYKDDEMRIQIKLNITIGRITLVDQFEWDINNPLNLPEDFARQMAWENALSGEFTTAIAHSIREQCQLYTKSLYLTNHPFDGRPIEDPDVRDAFLPAPIYSAFRLPSTQSQWMPYMYEMTEAELERTETSMMREHRAQKRQLNRRGGPALPDLKDRQRTVRSLLVHTVIPGAVESFETTGIPKTRRGGRTARRSGVRADGDADSDELDSDESGVDSPAPSIVNAGTARTRGMRGAATAAQAAMRASHFNARSATPELLATPEPRSSLRRSALREESLADDNNNNNEELIVKLKIPKAKYKAWWEQVKAKKRASEFPLSGYASQPTPLGGGLGARGSTPSKGGALSTPSMTPRSLPQSRSTPQLNGKEPTSAPSAKHDGMGRIDIERWPDQSTETPPPPPPWLNSAIQTLRQKHPDSDFEPTMRASTINATTNETARTAEPLAPGDAPPPGVKLQYLPRIRCNDCPGKLYTALPGSVIEQFEVHLRNRIHRANVERRQNAPQGA